MPASARLPAHVARRLADRTLVVLATTAATALMAALPAFADCVQLKDSEFRCKSPGCAPAEYSAVTAKNTRVALVFGNNIYRGENPYIKSLENAEADANDIAGRLKQQGFAVRCVLNGNARQASHEVEALADHLSVLQLDKLVSQEQIRVVVYFAGHGTRHKDANYIVFSDTFEPKLTENEFRVKARKVEDLLAPLKNYGKSHPFLIVDACRSEIPPLDNPDAPRVRGNFPQASSTDKLPDFPGYFVVYSTSDGKVADDGETRFMRFFADEFESWGRDFNSIVTRTQTLLKRRSTTKQTINYFGETPLAEREWRFSDDTSCDDVQHLLGSWVLKRCSLDMSTRECFESVSPTPGMCAHWNSVRTFTTVSGSCKTRLLGAFKKIFEPACSTSVVANAVTADAPRRIRLAGLSTDDTKTALATERLRQVVSASDVGTQPRGSTRGVASNPSPAGQTDRPIDRRTEWNDLVLVAKPGARVTEATPVFTTSENPPAGGVMTKPTSASIRTRGVKVTEALEIACDPFGCDKDAVSVNVFEKSKTAKGTRDEPKIAEIKLTDVAPRVANDVLIVKYSGEAMVPPAKDVRRLDELVRKYAARKGSRIRVTGGITAAQPQNAESRSVYERALTRAVGRSLKLSDRIVQLAEPAGFDIASQISAGETALVELQDAGIEPVYVEFYAPTSADPSLNLGP